MGREGSRSPVGEAIATAGALARELGYAETELSAVPAVALEAFAGAGALGPAVDAEPGARVADLGCGAGTDALILARRGFRVIAIDGARSMLQRLRLAAGQCGGAPVQPVRAVFPPIPLAGGAVAWVVMNGAANLVPGFAELLGEIRRVLGAGGVFLAADLLALGPAPADVAELPEAWAWCVGGARSPDAWTAELRLAGFRDVRIEVLDKIPPLARGLVRAVKR